MKANELRIGNYVWYKNRVRAKLELEDFEEMLKGHLLEMIEPIPLTEEWLIRFGFSDKDYKDGYIGKDVLALTKPKTLGEFQNGYAFEYRFGSLPLFKEFKWVHEFQNFWQSLTSEELTIKE